MSERPTPPFRRLLRAMLAVPAALWMVLEEWIWDSLTAAMRWLGRLPPVHWLETRIARLSPWAATAVFVVPWLLLLPAKMLALWLLGSGRLRLGVLVFVTAKVVGTALLAWLFTLTKPALLQIGWFRRFYTWFTALKQRLYAYVRSLRAYQRTRAWLAGVRSALRTWWRALRGA